MGLLRDQRYWVDVLTRMNRFKPEPGKALSKVGAEEVCRIGCEAFSKLVADPEYADDLQSAVQKGQAGDLHFKGDAELRAFIDAFLNHERKLLRDEGAPPSVIDDLDEEVRRTFQPTENDDERFYRLADKIAYCRTLACAGPKDEDSSDMERSTGAAIWRATKGIALTSVNLGAAAGAIIVTTPMGTAPAVGVVSGQLASISVRAGADLVKDALKRKW